MQFSTLGVVAAFAVVDAFLLPPEISAADTDIIKTLPFEDAVAMDGRVLEINCPGCPVLTDIEGKMHSAQVESKLELKFSLSHNNDGTDQLMLNGQQIYPMDPQTAISMEPLTASQMIKNSDDIWQKVSTPTLGYSLSVRHPVTASNNDRLDLVAIHIEIVEVANKWLGDIPGVELKLLQTPSGKLMIGNAEITPPYHKNPHTDNGQECTTLLCKWRAIVADRLSKLKGIKGCGSKPHAVGKVVPAKPKGQHGRPHGHGDHGPHRPFRHHRKHGGFARFLKGIVVHVFIPVLIGIMVGITASLVGMVVGHIAIFTWRLLFRRGQQYTKLDQKEIIVIEEGNDETKSFLENQGPPPVYEDVVVVEKPSK